MSLFRTLTQHTCYDRGTHQTFFYSCVNYLVILIMVCSVYSCRLWVNRRFFTANSTQLEEAGCEFEDKFTHDYRSIWSATEKNYGSSGGSYPTPLGGHACELVVKFSAEILATCDTVASDFEMVFPS